MIKSFKHRGLRLLFTKGTGQGLPSGSVSKLERILSDLNRAGKPRAMDLPGYRLHPLQGTLKGYWAVDVSGNFRVCFRMEEGDVYDVNLVDYH